MKIVHISTYQDSEGAAKATYKLHRGLIDLGVESILYVRSGDSSDNNVKLFKAPEDFISRFVSRLRNDIIRYQNVKYRNTRPKGLGLFSDDRHRYTKCVIKQLPESDLINLHWISDFIDYKTFFEEYVGKRKIIWRFADMNAFTGGCHYDYECARFNVGCGQCPQLGSSHSKDLSNSIWERKKKIFNSLNENDLHIVTTSRWMHNLVRTSRLLEKFKASIIPNSVDTETFRPRDKSSIRKSFNIPLNVKVVLFISIYLNEERKGLKYLLDALSEYRGDQNLILVSVGKGINDLQVRFPYLNFGYVNDTNILSILYNLADVVVVPSLQESFGQTIIEAMSCGVPVVGFDVGGIKDTVRNNETGFLVTKKDVKELREAIFRILEDQKLHFNMSRKSREVALNEYDLPIIADKYLKLYKEILNRKS